MRTFSVIIYLISVLAAAAADINGKLTVFNKGGSDKLDDFSNGLLYLTGTTTPPPEEPAISEQLEKNFVPRVLPVVKGQTVQFWNRDKVQHNVFCKNINKEMDLDRYPTGSYKAETFDVAGFYRIFCNIHQQMICDLVVLDNVYFATTGADGAFSIKNVPPGQYSLHAWHIYGGKAQRGITVENADINVEMSVVSTRILRQLMNHKNKFGKTYRRFDSY